MLSTQYRLRLEEICEKIIRGENVELSEMIWAEKLSSVNRSAATILRQARRRAANPNMEEGGLDDFLNQLDLGTSDPSDKGVRGFNSADEIADWFHDDRPNDWRQRD